MKKFLIFLMLNAFYLNGTDPMKRFVLKKYLKAAIEDCKIALARDESMVNASEAKVLQWEAACYEHGAHQELHTIQEYHTQQLAPVFEPNISEEEAHKRFDVYLKNADHYMQQYLDDIEKKVIEYPISLQGEKHAYFKKVLKGYVEMCEAMLAYKKIDASQVNHTLEMIERKMAALQTLIAQYDLEKEVDKVITECHGDEMLEALLESSTQEEYAEKLMNFAIKARNCLKNYLKNNL